MEKRIGVVIGRFQVPGLALHPGYRALLAHVARENDRVVVVLGEAIWPDQRNSVDIRTGLIQAWEG
jgi:nicotinamide mononucleotide adenylyltransferase